MRRLRKDEEGDEEEKVQTKLPCICLNVAPDISVYHVGPALDHGPLPAFFYFALSGQDSLTLDPFNQPIQFLQSKMVRAFSMDLPAHESGLLPKDALSTWAEELSQGKNFFEEFFQKVERTLAFLLKEQFIDPHHLSIGGLSRGGFAALHLAAREPKFRSILLFAPVTDLSYSKEFREKKVAPEHLKNLDLFPLTSHLSDRHIRFHIGNRDERVSTRKCFSFASEIVETGFTQHRKSPLVSFVTTPSIGHLGHGTSLETFQEGAHWLLDHLTISS